MTGLRRFNASTSKRVLLSTDFRTTDLVDVNWALTMINQRRLPPVLLMTPRITLPAHRCGRGPPWRMETNFRRQGLWVEHF